MKKFLLYSLFFISPMAFAQPTCPLYTSVGDASSPYILTSDPDCAICDGAGATGPWSGAACSGTIVSTAIAPTLSLTLAYTAVNTDDFATISIDGGGVMTLTGDGVGVAGSVIGPYLCDGYYGDVFLTVESTLPFTTVTLVNTGCSSGWVIACPGGIAEAGDDDLTTVLCNGSIFLDDLLSLDAEPGGIWTETSGSGAFDPITTEFDADIAGPGVYTFEYEVTGCGGIDVANFTVTVGLGGSAGEDNTAEICNAPGESINLNSLLIDADPGGAWAETSGSGAFNPLTGLFNVAGLPGGDYTFTYTFAIPPPCVDDVANFTVTVHPIPNVTIATDPASATICLGESITLTASGAGVGGTYVWDHPMTNGVAFTPPLGTDTYTVTATDAFGCSNTNDVDIEVLPMPSVIFTADTLYGCPPLTVEFTNLTILPGISCLWQFGDGSSSTSCGVTSHTYTTVGEFDVSLMVNSSPTCGSSVTYNDYILIKKQPDAKFSYLPNPIDIEDTRVNFSNASTNAGIYEWHFDDDTAPSNEYEPTHSFPEIANMTYNVKLYAMNDIGCVDSAFRKIKVEDVIIFYIPNVFTPDGDDFNEEFKPIMFSGYDVYNYHMTVYNKWGEILFESFNAGNGWNGTYGNGEIVADGVYIWQIEFGDTRSDEIHKYTGHVTLLK